MKLYIVPAYSVYTTTVYSELRIEPYLHNDEPNDQGVGPELVVDLLDDVNSDMLTGVNQDGSTFDFK